jgi:hypothetical protein
MSSQARVVVPPFVDGRRGRKEWTSRNTFDRKNYKDKNWWRMVERRFHHDILTTDGRDFKNNVRIPASFFDKIVTWFKDNGWTVRKWDKWGRAFVPLELKNLAIFEMLGRGVSAAVPAGLIGCNSKRIKNFYHLFCRKVALHLKHLHINYVQSHIDLEKNLLIPQHNAEAPSSSTTTTTTNTATATPPICPFFTIPSLQFSSTANGSCCLPP